MSRPLIGVCAPSERVDQGAWKDDLVDIAPSALVSALQDAGLVVVLVSYDASLVDKPDEVLRLLDGVALQVNGGPGSSGEAYRKFEQALASRAGELGLPVARLGDAGTINEFAKAVCARGR